MTVLTRILAAIAAGFLLLGGYLAFAQARFISTAVPVQARMLVAEKKYTHDSKGRTSEKLAVRYRYEAGGDTRESTALTPSALHATPNIDDMLQRFPAGSETTAWVSPADPRRAFLYKHHSFTPYLLALIAGPLLALAAGLATGGVRHVRSGESEFPDLDRAGDGWWRAQPFRANAALGRAAYGAAIAIAAVSTPVLGHYFSVADPPQPFAVLVAIATSALAIRLAWGGFSKNWTSSRLDDAALEVKPEHPRAGAPFTIRVLQSARSPVTIASFDVVLACEQTETKLVSRKSKTTRRQVVAGAASLPIGRLAGVGEPITAEHTFQVPADLREGSAFVTWRVELRTCIPGPDYRTKFFFPLR